MRIVFCLRHGAPRWSDVCAEGAPGNCRYPTGPMRPCTSAHLTFNTVHEELRVERTYHLCNKNRNCMNGNWVPSTVSCEKLRKIKFKLKKVLKSTSQIASSSEIGAKKFQSDCPEKPYIPVVIFTMASTITNIVILVVIVFIIIIIVVVIWFILRVCKAEGMIWKRGIPKVTNKFFKKSDN